MTKVTHHFDLTHALADQDAEAVARAHSLYGIARVWLAPSLDKITVDADATRMTHADVETALIRIGIPVKRAES